MKRVARRLIAYLLTLIMLLSVTVPAFGAELGTKETVQTQEIEQSGEEGIEETSKEQELEEPDMQEEASEEQSSEVTMQEESLTLNYVFTQDDETNQSVIMNFGEEDTEIEDAVLTYCDGEEVKTTNAETVAENFAVFLLPIVQEGVERVWESAVVKCNGMEHTVSLQDTQDVTKTEISEETASEVLEGTQEEPLDEETASQMEDAVILSEEEGITGEEIADAVAKAEELVPDADLEYGISTFLAGTNLRAAGKYVVVLDPGHGGYDSGAENQNGKDSESESKLTLKIANYVKQELEKSSRFTVYLTRTDDSYVGLSDRVNYAASKNADILVSLHLNSADSKTANGAEILVPRTGRYHSSVAEDAGKLAQDILKKIVELGLYNRGLIYRDSASGTKYPDGSTADYYAIVRQGLQAGIPSIIVEHAFISSTVDAKYLDSESDLQKLGKADAEGIAQYFNVSLSNNSNSNNSGKNGWTKENGNWYYYNSNVKQTGWQQINNKWYYMNSSGVMQTYWQVINGYYYFLGADGSMRTGWQNIWGKYYYFNTDGEMQYGWQKLDGVWYYLGGASDGSMKTGWQRISGKWYYLNSSGKMQQYWHLEDGKYYFLGANGSMRTGWQNIWNKRYYFNADGVMQSGWQRIDGAWYYFGNENNGAMQTGWQIVDHEYYYIVDSGVMQTYWRRINGIYYFFGANGVMRTGWQNIWGKWYYLDGNGAMQTGWQKISGKWYYLGSSTDGSMKTGWQTIDGKRYYFQSGGAMVTGTVTISGKKYEFDNDGALKDENETTSLYQITGSDKVTVSQMVSAYHTYSPISYPASALSKGGAPDIESFCKIIKEEADAENIKADVVFAQIMLETGYLKFGGDVKISQFNFAGLGATGNGVSGNSFKDVRTGIRAQVQHLKAYANKDALRNTCVDVRFTYVTRGTAPYVEWLGIQENPNGGGWAASKNYGNDLMELINKLKAI